MLTSAALAALVPLTLLAAPAPVTAVMAVQAATADATAGIAATPDGAGYWLVDGRGRVQARGTAVTHGDLTALTLNQPVVGIVATASGAGYWLVAADGGTFAFGDATFLGSMGGTPLNRPVVSLAPTPSGLGYWLVASDGGVFAFGDAQFLGSMGGTPLNRPVIGMTASRSGLGYRLVASDGGVFAFGDASFDGSTGGAPPSAAVVGLAPASTGGYWLAATNGEVRAFGNAPALGSWAGPLGGPDVVGIAANPVAVGYRLLLASGRTVAFGTAPGPDDAASGPLPYAGAPDCPALPADNIWNTPVDAAPVSSRSADQLSFVGSTRRLKADFGSGLWDGGPIGIPYTTIGHGQVPVPVRFEYDDESDPGPYPLPADAPIEGGPDADGDRHVLVVDRDACRLYEVYAAYRQQDGSWDAGSGAVYDLRSNALRPVGWTSADAAGLPILPGLVRPEEVLAGDIRHAIRVTVPVTRRAYIWPARHQAGSTDAPDAPPMGTRLRVKATVDPSRFPPQAATVVRALQRYGMIVADNGTSWYLTGVPDERWDNDDLATLQRLTSADLEVVDVSGFAVDPDTGTAAP